MFGTEQKYVKINKSESGWTTVAKFNVENEHVEVEIENYFLQS